MCVWAVETRAGSKRGSTLLFGVCDTIVRAKSPKAPCSRTGRLSPSTFGSRCSAFLSALAMCDAVQDRAVGPSGQSGIREDVQD